MTNIDIHNQEIKANFHNWNRKPLLREIYRSFYEMIAGQLTDSTPGLVVEIGSGAANIHEVIPDCIRTNLFQHPLIDRIENAYALSFPEKSVSNLILFDVFHHLRYPGTALKEFHRVLAARGRVIMLEPHISLLGRIVYGPFHKEPIGLKKQLYWDAPVGWNPAATDYYAAQGNATRVFLGKEVDVSTLGWDVLLKKRLSSISYVASGGYSGVQMVPACALPMMRKIDKALECVPRLFGTRLLVVLEKTDVV